MNQNTAKYSQKLMGMTFILVAWTEIFLEKMSY